jgi:MFS family permease
VPEVSARSPIGRLVAARSLNSFGRSIISSTVLWELFKRTDSPYVIAGVGVVQVLPVVLLFVPVGELVDRSDRRTLTTAAAMLAGAIGLGLAAASFFALPVAVYFTLLLAFGCLTAVHAPASVSLIPLIIPREDLVRTNRISSSLQEIATISGPALSGLALKIVDPHWVYSFVALTGIASGTLYRALPKPRAIQQAPTAAAARKDWRTGLRFIFNSPLLLPALTLDMFAMVFGLSTSLPLSVALLVVCGALDNVSVVIRLTLEQMVVPDRIRGRVSAVHFVFIGMSNELGAAESGVAAGLLGTIPAIVAGGAVAIAVVGIVAVKWRELATMPPLHELKAAQEP